MAITLQHDRASQYRNHGPVQPIRILFYGYNNNEIRRSNVCFSMFLESNTEALILNVFQLKQLQMGITMHLSVPSRNTLISYCHFVHSLRKMI